MKVGHFNQNSAFKKGILLSATFCLSWCGFKQILEPQSSLQPSCVYQNNKAMQAPTKKSAPLITFTDDFDITGDSKRTERLFTLFESIFRQSKQNRKFHNI